MKHLLLLFTLISGAYFQLSTARAVTVEEIADFFGIYSWRTTVALPQGSFSVAVLEIRDGAVGEPIVGFGAEEAAEKPEAGLSIVLGPRDGKYRVQIRVHGTIATSPTEIPLFQAFLSSSIPERVEAGDYVLFGTKKPGIRGGSKDPQSYARGFLLRVQQVPAVTAAEAAKATRCLANAKIIALACKLYSLDHDGGFPPDLDALFPD